MWIAITALSVSTLIFALYSVAATFVFYATEKHAEELSDDLTAARKRVDKIELAHTEFRINLREFGIDLSGVDDPVHES